MLLPLTEAEKTDARRFLGYPVYGLGFADGTFNRFFANSQTLEYRLVNLTESEVAVARTFLSTLNELENAIANMADNLVAAKAASYEHNPRELADRQKLYADWTGRFASYLGIPRHGNGSSLGSLRLVV